MSVNPGFGGQKFIYQTIKKTEQLFDANKRTTLPLLPKNIAIISVESSKGYQDFLDVIRNNSAGYKIHYKLFPAILQGDNAIITIKKQLEHIKQYKHHFDAVTIVRGGGGEVGLSCYDDYSLAKAVASYPLPVLTGIGHSTNQTVTELVSYENFITPTKIAEFLLGAFRYVDMEIQKAESTITSDSKKLIDSEQRKIHNLARLFKNLSFGFLNQNKQQLVQLGNTLIKSPQRMIPDQKGRLKQFANSLKRSAQERVQMQYLKLATRMNTFKYAQESILEKEKEKLTSRIEIIQRRSVDKIAKHQSEMDVYADKVKLLSPQQVLKRGYSITRFGDKSISDISELKKGSTVTTELINGTFESEVTAKKKK